MADPLVLEARDGDVVTLTLNDPARRNAMSRALGEAFAERIARLAADPELRAVVLTGAGSAFCAGGDLGMIEEHAAAGAARPGLARREIRDAMRSFYGLFLSVRDLPCPSVAAINGAAVGAGLCVALACDLRVAARGARLALNFAALGLHPGMGATWLLPRLVGPARAAELIYTGRVLEAEEAERIGLVNRVVEVERVLAEARELAARAAAGAPAAVRGAKRALARSGALGLEEQLAFEAAQQAACFETRDVREGLAAARERRPPRFTGA